MEPYRSAGYRCPTCPEASEAPLREFHDRFVCDECDGMLIGEPDFVAACSDLAGADLALTFDKEEATTRACPRCERALTSARLTVAPTKARAEVLRCPRDGIWIARDALTATFATVSRSSPGVGGPYWEIRGPSGVDGRPVPTGRSATSGLRISEWGNRPRRRQPTASPINLYADQRLACPACTTTELRFFGDRYACAQCTGTFVQNAALEAMIMDVSKEAFDLPLPTGIAGPRGCPVCTSPMLVEELEHVPIDRCGEHGVWFDPGELTVALERASGEFEPHGLRAWLHRVLT
jgi:Zn-finger nucleic acid-binding protein